MNSLNYGEHYTILEREYLSVKLISKMKINHNYCMQLYYALANMCCYSTTNIQVHFSSDSIYQNNNGIIVRVPHITNNNPLVQDTLNWQKMEGMYNANGTEEYLTIGNFLPDSLSNVLLFDTDLSDCTWGGAYYIIDDVRLYDCTQPDTTVFEISIFPNPNNGVFSVNYNLGEKPSGNFRIYDAIGKLIYDEYLTQNNGTLNLNLLLSDGVYLWQVKDSEGNLLRGDKIVVVK